MRKGLLYVSFGIAGYFIIGLLLTFLLVPYRQDCPPCLPGAYCNVCIGGYKYSLGHDMTIASIADHTNTPTILWEIILWPLNLVIYQLYRSPFQTTALNLELWFYQSIELAFRPTSPLL